MENKTIEFLNSKMWYRLLKVVYLIALVGVVLASNGVLVDEGVSRLDRDKTFIYCNGGEKRLSAKQADVSLNGYDFSRGFNYKEYYNSYSNSFSITGILMACYNIPPTLDIFLTQRVAEIKGVGNNKREYDEKYFNEQIELMKKSPISKSYLDYSIELFNIEPVYSYSQFIKLFLVINLSILALFDFLRRVFYYVFLGTIKPSKKSLDTKYTAEKKQETETVQLLSQEKKIKKPHIALTIIAIVLILGTVANHNFGFVSVYGLESIGFNAWALFVYIWGGWILYRTFKKS
jgi:hypothetical protein